MSNSFYRKVFISEIKESLRDEDLETDVIKIVMKCRILGVVTGIQKFSRRIIYSVDDGTGTLDCVLWHNESASTNRLARCLEDVSHNKDSDDICQVLLNKIQVNDEEFDYIHGDIISCLGHVKLVKKKFLLDITHHYKTNSANAETLWILDVLLGHRH